MRVASLPRIALAVCLTFAGSPAFAQYKTKRAPIVPVPYWMLKPDLRVESITASVKTCNDSWDGHPMSVVKFTVKIRNAGHRTAVIPKYGTDSWARMVTIDDFGALPQSAKAVAQADLNLYLVDLPVGKTYTWDETLGVPYAPLNFGGWKAGIRVYVDPDNVFDELDETNNYTERWFWFPIC
jgi:hypothetical protein